MYDQPIDRDAVVEILNRIMEVELAGVVRYSHYSLMVFGHDRIPVVEYLRSEAQKSLTHANQAGEMVTHLGAHPSLGIGPLLETHKHTVRDILSEALEHEKQALGLYRALLSMVEGKSVLFEEYARGMLLEEERDLGEVDKMLREPGDIAAFSN